MARQVRAAEPYRPQKGRAAHKKGGSLHKQPPKGAKPARQAHKRPAKADDPPALMHPPCAECGLQASLVGGDVIYPHRPDLAAKWFWRCPRCEPASYCGCHKGGDGKQSLGRPAGPYLRRARNQLHEYVDALWQRAETWACYYPFEGSVWGVRTKARIRVYQYIRVHMRLQSHEAHVGWMDLAQCRACWKLLAHTDGSNIRDWATNLTAEEEAFLNGES